GYAFMFNFGAMDFIIKGTLDAVKALYNIDLTASDVSLQETRKEFEGDITLVTFPLTRVSKKSPELTGTAIGEYLTEHLDEVSKFNVIKGFLNLSLTDIFLNSLFKNTILS